MLGGGFIALISAPLWLKPRPENRPAPSYNDPEACRGCRQCARDCPYEAIRMISRDPPNERRSLLVAQVEAGLCVSCGICAASCDSFTMGPPGRKASDQVLEVRGRFPDGNKEGVVVIACSAQSATLRAIARLAERERGVELHPVNCAGTVHAAVVEHLARRFRFVAIAACPERDCSNKGGFQLLRERIAGDRSPSPNSRIDQSRLPVFEVGPGEERELFEKLIALRDRTIEVKTLRGRVTAGVLRVAGAAALLVGIAGTTRLSVGREATNGLLRLSWRLAGQVELICRDWEPEELAKRALHMRTARDCSRHAVGYELHVEVDGKPLPREEIRPKGVHGDAPLYVNRDIPLAHGVHAVRIRFEPVGNLNGREAIRLDYAGDVEVRRGRAALIHIDPGTQRLVLKRGGAV